MNQASIGQDLNGLLHWHSSAESWSRTLLHIVMGALMTVAFAPAALVIQSTLGAKSVHILFLIPVIVAATRLGLVAALAAAFSASAVFAFFFYAPIYSLRVFSPDDTVALVMFISVAAITSHLSATARNHAGVAARNYRQLELLYAFSRKLAASPGPEEILAAVQEHASALVGRQVWVVTLDDGEPTAAASADLADLPSGMREAVLRVAEGQSVEGGMLIAEPSGSRRWLLRPFSRNARRPGSLVVELDASAVTDLDEVRASVDRLLAEAAATLERLDLATTVSEAEVRRRSEALREAIIGSASHALRTPLASILGSASVLARVPGVAGDERLSSLAQIIVAEAERLNGDIQKMLDAAALSGAQLKPDLGWIDPADLVNAALEARHRELAEHTVVVDCPQDLPLVRTDATLASGALGLVLDNAARYSDLGTQIRIVVRAEGGLVHISVEDEGPGLPADERAHIFEKFYRGTRARASTRGTGLGLWIADAFLAASMGRIAASARTDRTGTRLTIGLPAATPEEMEALGETDE
ncbi:MAG: ATP-binding protein [Hyphomicrobiaceae bacterium]